uniref:50S ribosomal protein L20 n=1 Tax=Pedobesia claviformis TaxID=2364088 RepID=A0A386B0T9_9CHLO|nr:ribosomal protein L20 [Pedobesia claviformis]AYC65316.1 ribosomal protein L20 [Pedobesia claviformis]
MIRVKRGRNIRQRRKNLLNQAKSFVGASKQLYRLVKQKIQRAESYNYIHRHQQKRWMRRIWITRLNATFRLNNYNYNYTIHQYFQLNIHINRKISSQLLLYDNFSNLKLFNLF